MTGCIETVHQITLFFFVYCSYFTAYITIPMCSTFAFVLDLHAFEYCRKHCLHQRCHFKCATALENLLLSAYLALTALGQNMLSLGSAHTWCKMPRKHLHSGLLVLKHTFQTCLQIKPSHEQQVLNKVQNCFGTLKPINQPTKS